MEFNSFAKEIFNVCTNKDVSEESAIEAIDIILQKIYDKGRADLAHVMIKIMKGDDTK